MYMASIASPIGTSAFNIAADSPAKIVFVIVRRICGYARSIRLIIAAQIRSRKNTALYGE